LSKELGVTSKAIIAKCQREGVEGVTNHMSTVSAGLAETIREWFGEEHHGTAVEEAAPVDLEKARAKRRPSRRKKQVAQKAAAEGADDTATAVAVEEAAPSEVELAPAEPAPRPAEEVTPPAAPTEAPAAAPAPDLPVEAEPVAPVEPPREEPAAPPSEAPPEQLRPAAKAPEPEKPAEPVRPAGPQNVPAPAQMKGPQVVGFAKPDPIVRPTPRSSFASSPGTSDTGSAPPGSRRGGKPGAKPSLRDDTPTKRSRQRLSPRRSGASTADVGERLREWRDRDLLERQERLEAASGRGIHRRAREKQAGPSAPHIAERKTRAEVTEPITLLDLCTASGIGMMQLMPRLSRDHGMGMVNRNTVVPSEIAEMVMLEFGVELVVHKPKTELDRLAEEFARRERKNLQPRPPVVTMLGHVDHGKTSLLDAIRRTAVAESEAGGITQHIGAYQVEHGNLKVTFLDTPGHEAFTAMRARGANMTDVVVLVVAADDGVMPQTVEAINHAKAAKVTIVIALNKIDLPGVDINKVYGRLAELELSPSEWGGETDVVKTSATTGEGVEALIEHLATLSELLDLKADPKVPAQGAVIEAEMKTGIGPLARLLVQEGTLKTGDFLVCGPAAGRIRMMRDDRGRSIKQATPGMPVEVAGLDEVPNAGDKFYQMDSLQRSKQIADEIKDRRRQESLTRLQKPQTLQDILQKRETGEIPELNLILRADMQGSIDALLQTLNDIPSEEVKLNILHTGIGSVTESDIVLAEASGALVVGFNVTADPGAQRLAESQGVDLRSYRVIYDLVADIRRALEGLLPAIQTEEARGRAEVRDIFRVSKVGMIAGCMVTDGVITRNHRVRVVRDGQIVVPTEEDVQRRRHRTIDSLKRFKDDVREVRAGMECGIRVEGFDDVKPGDILESYELIETARTL
jgi:translation initiation factor IF-2